MAKKRRPTAPSPAPASSPAAAPSVAASPSVPADAIRTPPAGASAPPLAALPGEVTAGDWTVPLLALMMFLAPALGVPHEEMLQDTLKSTVVSFLALGAALLLFMGVRRRTEGMRWHSVIFLPLLLMAYALGSMAWSQTYLAGVEAVRLFVFSLIVWLALNTLAREKMPLLAWGIHAGAVVASLWTALQFWFDLRLFPQGPNPASTFINRNFFAEFAVCTLPFTALLLARARQSAGIAMLAASGGFVIVAILMTGTRSALIALWLQLFVVLPFIAWRCRRQLAFPGWPSRIKALAAAVLAATVLGLGAIPSGNPKLLEEERGTTALARAFNRTQSIAKAGDPSLSMRMTMWRATIRVIEANPVTGVGAGAWENEIPLYQEKGTQLENDYYVHNEFLQLIAEYGLAGWAFLVTLFGYLLLAAWKTLRADSNVARDEAPLRAVLLCSLLAFLIVSNAGFPWRMATTGALFALCLGGLAASDCRLGFAHRAAGRRIPWSPAIAMTGLAATIACLAVAAVIAQRAAESESKIVRAARIALSITSAGDYNNPRYRKPKQEMLELIRQGTDINPHYRKITPIIADELARWGDWGNAIWIWESVLSSRPNVVAIMANAARGQAATGHPEKAFEYLARMKKLQPTAPAVRSLEVVLLSRTGREAEAWPLARQAIEQKTYDFDLVSAAFVLAARAGDYPYALKAMQIRLEEYPWSRARGYFQLGMLYHEGIKDPQRALEAFRRSLDHATRPGERGELLALVPAPYQAVLAAAPSLPPNGTQTSASKR